MTIRFTCPRLAAGTAAVVTIGLFLSGVAWAVTGNAFRYSSPRTGWLNINQAALVPDTVSRSFSKDHGFLSAPAGCFQTDVFLPDGARLTKLTVWHAGTMASKLQFLLFRESSNAGVRQAIVSRFNTDISGNRVAKTFLLSGPLARINNNAFSYAFMVCFTASNVAFASARLTYTYRDAGD